MASNYNTVVEAVQAEQWTGSNLDAIVAFVGAGNYNVIAGNLSVFGGVPVPPGQYVIKTTADGKFREVADSTKLSQKYTPDNP